MDRSPEQGHRNASDGDTIGRAWMELTFSGAANLEYATMV